MRWTLLRTVIVAILGKFDKYITILYHIGVLLWTFRPLGEEESRSFASREKNMKLIIAEKHQLALYIADAIPGPTVEKNGSITKGDYCITWASGHLLSLLEPKDYDPEYAKWNLDALPIFFDDWGHKVSDSGGSASKIKIIGNLLKESDCAINAGDPDDEGQCLIDEILEWFKYKKPVYRLDTNNTTVPGLQKALANLEDNDEFVSIGKSAYARSVADMMVGVNLSRFFTMKNYPAKLIVGRVQTPTLGLVVERDRIIENHIKQTYFDIYADLKIGNTKVTTKYAPNKDDPNLDNGLLTSKTYAQNRVDMLDSETIEHIEITSKVVDEQPPLPFNLVELQGYCSKKFGYGLNDVMEITQRLRDDHNAISYNRSDCQYLNDDQFAEAPDTMQHVLNNIGFSDPRIDLSIKSRCFDESVTKEAAHTAIIPLATDLNLNDLDQQEKNVYLAICKYYIAQFYPPAKKQNTKLSANLVDGGKLTASSTLVLDEGYLVLFKKDKTEKDNDTETEEVTSLSQLQPGVYSGDVVKTWFEEKETKPPKRYTQGTLNKDMTRISRFVEDAEIKKLLIAKDKDKKSENGSIGTPATRATIIQNLIDRGFLEEKGKNLISTPLGRELCRILPKELVAPDLTARWWVIQEDIKHGDATPKTLTDNVLNMITEIIGTDYPKVNLDILPESAKMKGSVQKETIGTCPACGKPVVEGKKGFGCSGWRDGCKFVIWKKPGGNVFKNISITKKDAKDLLAGKTINKKNFISKAGKSFDAGLKMKDPDPEYGAQFEFVFNNDKKGKKT